MVNADFHGLILAQEKTLTEKGICPVAEELNDKTFLELRCASMSIVIKY